jgi:head-tail adaptor
MLDIEPVAASEPTQETRVGPVVSHRAVGRWMPGITPAMRLVWVDTVTGASRVFAIVGVWDIDARRRELQLRLSEEIGGPNQAG